MIQPDQLHDGMHRRADLVGGQPALRLIEARAGKVDLLWRGGQCGALGGLLVQFPPLQLRRRHLEGASASAA